MALRKLFKLIIIFIAKRLQSRVRYRYNKSPPETSFGESGSEASEE